MPWDDPDAWRQLSESTTTPILCGENVYLRHGFRRIVDQRAVDVIAPDIQDCGGIADAKWLAEFADLYNVLIAPHNAQGAISFMANVHTAAAMPRNFIAFEFHAADSPWWQDLVVGVDKPLIRAGFATVPDAPGLGIELNGDVVQRHMDPGQRYFE
jgi:L-alanine-DL-glutamate epimerase-like enolase superfamily enzyme